MIGLVSWHINIRGLYNDKAILVEKQQLDYLADSWGIQESSYLSKEN